MGRGRAKAKQTKVARELKYNSGGMDLDRLRADLIHEDDEVDPELLAKYGDLADADQDDGDQDDADQDDPDQDDPDQDDPDQDDASPNGSSATR